MLPDSYEPFSIFVMAPGAFFVLAILTAVQNKLKLKSATNGDAPQATSTLACGGNCAECVGETCTANRMLLEQKRDEAAAKKADVKAVNKNAFPETAGDKTGSEGGNR